MTNFDIEESGNEISVESRETPLQYFHAVIYPSKQLAHVFEMHIEEKLRGKGYGRKVIHDFIELCKKYKVKFVTGIPEKTAQPFWKAVEFDVIPRDQKHDLDKDLPYSRSLSPLMVKELSLISVRQADLLDKAKANKIIFERGSETKTNTYVYKPNQKLSDIPLDERSFWSIPNMTLQWSWATIPPIVHYKENVIDTLDYLGYKVVDIDIDPENMNTFTVLVLPIKEVKADLLPRIKDMAIPDLAGKQMLTIFSDPNYPFTITFQDGKHIKARGGKGELDIDLKRYDVWVRDGIVFVNYKGMNVGREAFVDGVNYGVIIKIDKGIVHTDLNKTIDPLKVKFKNYGAENEVILESASKQKPSKKY